MRDVMPALKTASKVGSCVPPIKVRQDDKTVTTSIGAAAAVLILGAILCYVVYRNSAQLKHSPMSLKRFPY